MEHTQQIMNSLDSQEFSRIKACTCPSVHDSRQPTPSRSQLAPAAFRVPILPSPSWFHRLLPLTPTGLSGHCRRLPTHQPYPKSLDRSRTAPHRTARVARYSIASHCVVVVHSAPHCTVHAVLARSSSSSSLVVSYRRRGLTNRQPHLCCSACHLTTLLQPGAPTKASPIPTAFRS